MKMKWLLGVIIILLLLTLGLLVAWNFTREKDMTEEEKILSHMSLDEKIGQLFFVGLDGTELTDQDKAILSEYKIGNVIIFDSNIESKEQLALLNEEIQAYIGDETELTPFIAIDTEEFQGNLEEIITDFPVNMAFSATGDKENAYYHGLYLGKELQSLGFTMNLNPIADVNVNPLNPVEGVNSYGDSPDQVAVFATEYIRGLEENGITAVIKYFPGTGDARADEDTGLSMVYREKEFLRNQEMYPFVKAIAANVEAIMAADVYYPDLEDGSLPASLSPTIINELLRKELNYQNLVVNSSLVNPLIVEEYGEAEIAVQSVLAGVNLMIADSEDSTNGKAPYIAAIEAIKTAINNGTLTEEQLDTAVTKIIKKKLTIADGLTVSLTPSTKEDHQNFAKEISQASITIQRDNNKIIPLNYKNTLFISPLAEGSLVTDEDSDLEENATAVVLADKLNGDYFTLEEGMDASDKQKLAALAADYDKVVILLDDASIANGQYAMVNVLLVANPNLIVISDNPYDMLVLPKWIPLS